MWSNISETVKVFNCVSFPRRASVAANAVVDSLYTLTSSVVER